MALLPLARRSWQPHAPRPQLCRRVLRRSLPHRRQVQRVARNRSCLIVAGTLRMPFLRSSTCLRHAERAYYNRAMSIAENLHRVQERIARAAESAGRAPSDITLVGVTKYVGADEAAELVAAGCRHLGESRPQELWHKADAFQRAGRPRPRVLRHALTGTRTSRLTQTLKTPRPSPTGTSSATFNATKSPAPSRSSHLSTAWIASASSPPSTKQPGRARLPPSRARPLKSS